MGPSRAPLTGPMHVAQKMGPLSKEMKMSNKASKQNSAQVLVPDVQQDLALMHTYVEGLRKGGERNFPLVATQTFVESMRDSGYKSTATAINELLDNAVQARASRIDVVVARVPGKEEIAAIAVLDD